MAEGVDGEGLTAADEGETIVTAAVLVIGDEILSGRTKDQNIGYIAAFLTGIGIDLREARVVPDVEDDIVAAVNALRARYTHVFTTGGIGGTHDDITADAVGKAFGLPVEHNAEAAALLTARFPDRRLNDARLRMARMPVGATLIPNAVTTAPGFSIGNVHVMAGVPAIMQRMLDALAPRLSRGRPMLSHQIAAGMGEGDYAAALTELQAAFPDIAMGSYPSFDARGFSAAIVLRCRDTVRLAEGVAAVEAMLAGLRAAKAAG